MLFFNQSSITNFFLPFGRVWELIIGILIAFYLKKNGQPLRFNEIFSLIGLLLIFYSIFIFTPETNYPSFNTLIPTLGTGLLILFMNNKTFIYKVLSSKILVFLGLISYSSYLYHFPIFTFIEYSNLLEDTLAIKLAIILLILFISFLSWKYIEKPFRDREKISFKNIYFNFIYSICDCFFSWSFKFL